MFVKLAAVLTNNMKGPKINLLTSASQTKLDEVD